MRVRLGVLLLVGAMALGACGTEGEDPADGRTKVVAAFYPLFEAAQRVGGAHVQVTNVTPAGGEPHDIELSSRQLDRIEDAAVVLYFGHGFQPGLEKVAARAKGTKVDLLSEAGTLLGAPPGDQELDVDPHVWLDPTLFKGMVTKVATALSRVDPANQGAYEANAAAYGRELDDLDSAYRQGLAQCDRKVIVTSHAAFGYLARRYGLGQEAVAGLQPDAEPTPQRLAELASQVRAQGTRTIFYETLVSPKVAQTLAREAGVSTAALDPLEGLSDDALNAGATYISVMRENLATLRSALGCR